MRHETALVKCVSILEPYSIDTSNSDEKESLKTERSLHPKYMPILTAILVVGAAERKGWNEPKNQVRQQDKNAQNHVSVYAALLCMQCLP
jgi:hypothetical protein